MSHRIVGPELGTVADPPAAVRDDPVLAAARDVILTHGPRRATLAEVARQAGVSRMTVYRRFESFDRLLSALLTAELAAVIHATGPDHPQDDAGTRAVRLVVGMTRGLARHPLLGRVLRIDPESMVPLMVSRYGQTQRAAIDLLIPLLAAGMAGRGGDGTIRDAEPAALARTLVTAAQSFVFAAQAIDDSPDGEQVWREWPIMVAGFLAPPPDRSGPGAP